MISSIGFVNGGRESDVSPRSGRKSVARTSPREPWVRANAQTQAHAVGEKVNRWPEFMGSRSRIVEARRAVARCAGLLVAACIRVYCQITAPERLQT